MFNSYMIEIAQELDGGVVENNNPIVKAVYEKHCNIIDMSVALWEATDPSDVGFKEQFAHVFPPGYITRDITKAKRIIHNLLDIAYGYTVRYELETIYIYVMYHLIESWDRDDQGIQEKQIPEPIQEYLNEKKIKKNSETYKRIRRWFIEENVMAEDFADRYDEDCTDEVLAENNAYVYLEKDFSDAYHKILGIEVKDYIDLLPNDLYYRVKEKYEAEQEEKKRIADNQSQRTNNIDSKKILDITKEIIYACLQLSDNPTITRDMDEDRLNQMLRNLLESSVKHYGFSVQDQTQRGCSATGNKPGELDLRIVNKEGFPETICECLIHKDEKYLHNHIQKAIKNYNPIGCKRIYIICYSRNKDFKKFWETFRKWVANCSLVKEWKEASSKYGGIRCAMGIFDCLGEIGVISFIGVNIG